MEDIDPYLFQGIQTNKRNRLLKLPLSSTYQIIIYYHPNEDPRN